MIKSTWCIVYKELLYTVIYTYVFMTVYCILYLYIIMYNYTYDCIIILYISSPIAACTYMCACMCLYGDAAHYICIIKVTHNYTIDPAVYTIMYNAYLTCESSKWFHITIQYSTTCIIYTCAINRQAGRPAYTAVFYLLHSCCFRLSVTIVPYTTWLGTSLQ